MSDLPPASLAPGLTDPGCLARALHPPGPVALLLDYDGTMVPFACRPDLAIPDQPLLDLVDLLARRPGWQVHIVSGRLRVELDRWFGTLDVGLHAEHGAWTRLRQHDGWERTIPNVESWPADIVQALRQGTSSLPGAFLELKSASMAFHYREVRRDFVINTIPPLRRLLQALCRQHGLGLLDGAEVLEVRAPGLSKAGSAARILAALPARSAVVAIGDDHTDEELFGALPARASTVRVGEGATRAKYRLAGPQEVRTFLSNLACPGSINTPWGSADP